MRKKQKANLRRKGCQIFLVGKVEKIPSTMKDLGKISKPNSQCIVIVASAVYVAAVSKWWSTFKNAQKIHNPVYHIS